MEKPTSKRYSCCFQPDSVIELIEKNSYDQPRGPVKPMEGKDTNVVSNQNHSKLKSSRGSRKKKSMRRILSKIIKAVFFESSLMKKIKHNKIRQSSFRSESGLSSKVKRKQSKEVEAKMDAATLSSSCRSSLSISSNSNSSFSSSSSLNSSRFSCDRNKSFRSGSFDMKQFDGKKSFRSNSFEFKHSMDDLKTAKPGKTSTAKTYNSINGLYLLLISLLVLILWGRLCAILCTSAWIYFAPTRRGSEEDGLEGKEKLLEIESKEYKKRVIMEGLLERNHSRA